LVIENRQSLHSLNILILEYLIRSLIHLYPIVSFDPLLQAMLKILLSPTRPQFHIDFYLNDRISFLFTLLANPLKLREQQNV